MKFFSKKLLLLASVILFSKFTFAQCPEGDVILTTAEETANFNSIYPDCTEINGDLIIDGDNAYDYFNHFNQITSINGDLILKNTNRDEFFLDALTSVDKIILDNNDGLVTIEIFEIVNINEIVIKNNDTLEIISLSGPNTINNIFIENNSSEYEFSFDFFDLEMVTGSVVFKNNIQLIATSFPDLISVNDVNIEDNNFIMDNNSEYDQIIFPKLVSANNIYIKDNNHHYHSNFSILESVNKFEFINNNDVVDLNLSNLNDAKLINVISNNQLSECDFYCPLLSGLYWNSIDTDLYFYENKEGCSSVIEICPEILDVNEESKLQFSIKPNPAKNTISIQTEKQISKIEIFDITGKKIIQKYNTDQINVQNLENGIYFIKIFNSRNNIITEKFIKE
ncbi:T9SS type A sorting domain-containing protein [Aureivirga sp. CE67]|uniref:T9SS type A sorting domain-containing protein n=1 Tax=Aureivirga sp. CE67 TaxID=1788983 RepID=UPI0018CB58E8|nr:T9SS type A sorting domain-containing protein [Aureivirga sp. CE67]